MRHASSHNYRNSLFIVDMAMGQIPRFTERISSFLNRSSRQLCNCRQVNKSPQFLPANRSLLYFPFFAELLVWLVINSSALCNCSVFVFYRAA